MANLVLFVPSVTNLVETNLPPPPSLSLLSECELGWQHREGNCYHLTKENVEYGEAVAACESMGASLVTAKTEGMMDFLSNISFW